MLLNQQTQRVQQDCIGLGEKDVMQSAFEVLEHAVQPAQRPRPPETALMRSTAAMPTAARAMDTLPRMGLHGTADLLHALPQTAAARHPPHPRTKLDVPLTGSPDSGPPSAGRALGQQLRVSLQARSAVSSADLTAGSPGRLAGSETGAAGGGMHMAAALEHAYPTLTAIGMPGTAAQQQRMQQSPPGIDARTLLMPGALRASASASPATARETSAPRSSAAPSRPGEHTARLISRTNAAGTRAALQTHAKQSIQVPGRLPLEAPRVRVPELADLYEQFSRSALTMSGSISIGGDDSSSGISISSSDLDNQAFSPSRVVLKGGTSDAQSTRPQLSIPHTTGAAPLIVSTINGGSTHTALQSSTQSLEGGSSAGGRSSGGASTQFDSADLSLSHSEGSLDKSSMQGATPSPTWTSAHDGSGSISGSVQSQPVDQTELGASAAAERALAEFSVSSSSSSQIQGTWHFSDPEYVHSLPAAAASTGVICHKSLRSSTHSSAASTQSSSGSEITEVSESKPLLQARQRPALSNKLPAVRAADGPSRLVLSPRVPASDSAPHAMPGAAALDAAGLHRGLEPCQTEARSPHSSSSSSISDATSTRSSEPGLPHPMASGVHGGFVPHWSIGSHRAEPHRLGQGISSPAVHLLHSMSESVESADALSHESMHAAPAPVARPHQLRQVCICLFHENFQRAADFVTMLLFACCLRAVCVHALLLVPSLHKFRERSSRASPAATSCSVR